MNTNILLVEDNIADARLIRDMLLGSEGGHFELQTVSQLSEAITLIRKAPFDIVLLDLGLPDSQCLETLATYLESAAEIPVIVLTGLAADEISVQAIENGAQDFLVKGRIDGPMLFRAIRYAISRAKQESKRRQADEALKTSEKRFRDIADHAQEWIWEVDAKGKYTYASPMVERMLGYTQEEILQKHFYDGFHPDDRESLKTAALAAFAVKQPFRDFINRNVHRNGQTVWLSTSGLPLLDEKGNLLGYRGVDTDITERRQSERALKDSEERFRVLFEESKDGIVLVGVDSKKFYMGNNTFCDMVQYTPDEISQLGILDVHPKEDVPWIIEEFDRRSRHEPEIRMEIPVKRKDGSIFFADIKSSPVMISGKQFILGNFRDITKLRMLENQLRTSQKMEAVGTLAGGIAHDFNNALTGIIGFGELLRRRIPGEDQALRDLDEILRCAERAATLTRQLLTFARRQVIQPVNLNVSTLIEGLMRFIVKVVGEHIEVKTSSGRNVPTIHADRGQIEQVVMNLCLNARDAMPEGGRLVVETEDVYLEEEHVRQNPHMRAGRYALITVLDTGVGMDEKTCERVFEPFFTTKGQDKGTGLGLAMVYGIVKQHGGFIHLYSELGKGAAFKVYFPAIEAQPDDLPKIRREEIVRGGKETILLAEDEEIIRALGERTLKELGYTVLVARNGEEAVEMFGQNQEILLAVLDVVMPRKGGKEAFEEMRKQNPRLKVIFTSGYSAGAIHDAFVLIPDTPFLQKPFGPTILARKVREVLDTH